MFGKIISCIHALFLAKNHLLKGRIPGRDKNTCVDKKGRGSKNKFYTKSFRVFFLLKLPFSYISSKYKCENAFTFST